MSQDETALHKELEERLARHGTNNPMPKKYTILRQDPRTYAYALVDKLKSLKVRVCRRKSNCVCDNPEACECDDFENEKCKDFKLELVLVYTGPNR